MSDSLILDKLPHYSIPQISGEPNYYPIKKVEKKIIINTASTQTELGGGNHGYLGLIMTPEKYESMK